MVTCCCILGPSAFHVHIKILVWSFVSMRWYVGISLGLSILSSSLPCFWLQFADEGFASLSGARVVRIATHPDFQGMGYGSRSLRLLSEYYQGKLTSLKELNTPLSDEAAHFVPNVASSDGLLKETICPRSHLPPLLAKLSDCPPETLDYIGVSYGLTSRLYKYDQLTVIY